VQKYIFPTYYANLLSAIFHLTLSFVKNFSFVNTLTLSSTLVQQV